MRREEIEQLIGRHGPQAVIEVLTPFVTQRRRERIEAVVAGRLRGVEIAIEAPSDPHNAAAVVRTAEALGVLGVHVIAAQGDALHAKSTTQGSYHWVETHHHADLTEFIADVSTRGRDLYGAWMDAPLSLEDVPVSRPVCLILGNESRGLSQTARDVCRGGYRIPMVGMSESLNLSVSAAISLYDLCRRRRALAGASDLEGADRDQLRARYYMRSVDDRMIRGVFEPPDAQGSVQ